MSKSETRRAETVDKRHQIKLLSLKNERKAERLNVIEESRKQKLISLIVKDTRVQDVTASRIRRQLTQRLQELHSIRASYYRQRASKYQYNLPQIYRNPTNRIVHKTLPVSERQTLSNYNATLPKCLSHKEPQTNSVESESKPYECRHGRSVRFELPPLVRNPEWAEKEGDGGVKSTPELHLPQISV